MAATPDLKDALVNKKKFSTFTNKEGMKPPLHFGAAHTHNQTTSLVL